MSLAHGRGPPTGKFDWAITRAAMSYLGQVSSRVGPSTPRLQEEDGVDAGGLHMPLESEIRWIEGDVTAVLLTPALRSQVTELANQRHGGRPDREAAGTGPYLVPEEEHEVIAMRGEALVQQPGHQGALPGARRADGQKPTAISAGAPRVNLGELGQHREAPVVHAAEDRFRRSAQIPVRFTLLPGLMETVSAVRLRRYLERVRPPHREAAAHGITRGHMPGHAIDSSEELLAVHRHLEFARQETE